MKLNLFSKPYKLDALEVETLKVALIDAQKQVEYQRSLINNDDSPDLVPIVNKSARLQTLIKKLELDNVCM